MRHRRSYYHRDPDTLPDGRCCCFNDATECLRWWRELLPLRRIDGLWDFFEKQPADIRQAGHELIGALMGDPKERDTNLYQIYRGRLHMGYRLDTRIAWQLYMAAQNLLGRAEKDVALGRRLSWSLVPLQVLHDQMLLLHEAWVYVRSYDDRHGKEGLRGGQRSVGMRALCR